ncbi:AraC family transcriptional regulator [Paenibacillus sp. HWE-109]|uniref:AraC family transcriptional regulator n=1 Tax=Paenibacillus sp. HWE-109 TaxID=1306526 RepID=UPI001EDF2F21|nr:AraC family transcriptional regulator [Paenibacillus sp. HWE-109]UKS27064.1 AraC family transcriptional regulator [Paenibacillus sp. HWE-109]
MELERVYLNLTIEIRSIITMYYFEFGKDYVFSGESHDFWEMVYVDKGEVEVIADTTSHTLKTGSLIFHKPNEFHSFTATHGRAPNVIVITFDCYSKAMEQFENKVFQLQDEERNRLAQIIEEGANTFIFPFKYPLTRKQNAEIGSEQLLKNYLEMFLILLLRKETHQESDQSLSFLPKEKDEAQLVTAIIHFLEERLDSQISLTEISDKFHVAKTKLKDLFAKHTGKSIKEYFMRLKIDKAKVSIREDVHNFTEIAQRLGFSSVHYFSKAFKRVSGMSPSEYARSVKARSRIGS